MEPKTEQIDAAPENTHPANTKAQVLTSAEGRVLILGIALTLLYMLWLGIQLLVSVDTFQKLLGMTATKVVFGRAACIAYGYSLDLSHTQVLLTTMFVQTIQVLIFYPSLVFLWQQMLVIKWLKKMSDRVYTAAHRHKDKVRRFGIPGLFLFVCIPTWMTGPVVGCMVGYLIGMKTRVTVITVLAGSYAAILIWTFVLYQLHQETDSYSSYAILTLTLLTAAVMLIAALWQHAAGKQKKS